MRTHAERLQQIEELLDLIKQIEIEPDASVRLETDLLIAYSLVRIEQHLADLKERHGEALAGRPGS